MLYANDLKQAEDHLQASVRPTDGSTPPPFGYDTALPILQGNSRWRTFMAKLVSCIVVVEDSVGSAEPVFTGKSEQDNMTRIFTVPKENTSATVGVEFPLDQIVATFEDLDMKQHSISIRCAAFDAINSTVRKIVEAISTDTQVVVNGAITIIPSASYATNTLNAAKDAIRDIFAGIVSSDQIGNLETVVLVEPRKEWKRQQNVENWVGYKLVKFEKKNNNVVTDCYLTLWRLSHSASSDYAMVEERGRRHEVPV